MLRTGTVLAIALAGGCAFDSFERGRTETLGGATEDEEMVDTRPGASGTRGAADGDSGVGTGGDTGPPATSGLPPGTDDGRPPPDFGSADESEGGTPNNCDMIQTFELTIDDAAVFEPMVAEQVTGVGLVAYSTEYDAGDVEFTVDIACEGDYFVYAFVADLWDGVHTYDDPDSYLMTWPGGSATWFYGCQTWDLPKWNWLPVLDVIPGGDCGTGIAPPLSLTVGTHAIRFHNREAVTYDDRVAAIARVVVTDDPLYDPL